MQIYIIVEGYKKFESWFMDVFNDFKMFNCDIYLGNPCRLTIYCGLLKYTDHT